ncbi:MAG: VWA domain-containing protein [Deltaproteobacteria bacterium]|nr:VWA domain-containing protein [Deltaproteobacteria bacterium]
MTPNAPNQAHRVRTTFVLGAAGATVIAALLLTGRTAVRTAEPVAASDDGIALTAKFTSTKLLSTQVEQFIAVSITTPGATSQVRPPLSVAVVIDRSGSMSGEPMENAKAAAARLVGELGPDDAFTVVTYSSGDEVVYPMNRATAEHKAAARSAINRIYDDGGTCISCGLTRGAGELARSPISGGLQRIVLISDGQANEGIYDRSELAQLAANTAARGVSITALGVGLDFDEVTMQRIAEVGRGRYYFVEDTAQLAQMFSRELGGLADTVAADVRLLVDGGPGVKIVSAIGYPMEQQGDWTIVSIPDLRAGETRKVVLRVTSTSDSLAVGNVQLGWRRVSDGSSRRATAVAEAEIVDNQAEVIANIDRGAMQAVEEALSSEALDRATTVYESQGYDAAKRVLQERVDQMNQNAYVPAAARARIEAATTEAADSFRAEPAAKAKKVSRVKAYELAQ